jgi:hypothetical protein
VQPRTLHPSFIHAFAFAQQPNLFSLQPQPFMRRPFYQITIPLIWSLLLRVRRLLSLFIFQFRKHFRQSRCVNLRSGFAYLHFAMPGQIVLRVCFIHNDGS